MSMNDFINTLTEEQKAALLNALMNSSDANAQLPKKTNETTKNTRSSSVPTASTNDDFTMKRQESNNRRKEVVRARRNDWVDEGEFRDIETPKVERTPRNRQPNKKVEVDCSICGRSFKTDSKYIYGEHHRCSRCTGR